MTSEITFLGFLYLSSGLPKPIEHQPVLPGLHFVTISQHHLSANMKNS
jgi:hypothetical protein